MHFMVRVKASLASDQSPELAEHLKRYMAWVEDVLQVIDAYSILQEPKWADIFDDEARRIAIERIESERVFAGSPTSRLKKKSKENGTRPLEPAAQIRPRVDRTSPHKRESNGRSLGQVIEEGMFDLLNTWFVALSRFPLFRCFRDSSGFIF